MLHKSGALCGHQRRIVSPVPETMSRRRDEAPPCHCQRSRYLQCNCALQRLYCGRDCVCNIVNLFNYQAVDDPTEEGYQADQKDLFFSTASVPIRIKKEKSKRRRTAAPDDRTLGEFLRQGGPAPEPTQPDDEFMDL